MPVIASVGANNCCDDTVELARTFAGRCMQVDIDEVVLPAERATPVVRVAT